MLYMLGLLFIIVIILIVFLYYIWKDDSNVVTEVKNQTKQTEQQIISTIKKTNVDSVFFENWLNSIEINNNHLNLFKNEIRKKIVWMDDFINAILINLLVWWHLLVEWVPWLAKTKTIETLSKVLDMKLKRIQFTPDMLPSDIIWVEIFNTKTGNFEIKQWPVFTNILLADEINRTTPKVQSALLEAMQEKKISIWWETFILPKPFFVLATQNPIEQEWTYSLPEAQVDRFLFKVLVKYPEIKEEKQILDILEQEDSLSLEKVISLESFIEMQSSVKSVYVSDDIKDYIVRLIWKTREKNDLIVYGASPRASIWIMNASKALAFLAWRDYVNHEDVQRVSLNVLRHRVILSYDAKVDWLTEDEFLIDILSKVSLE